VDWEAINPDGPDDETDDCAREDTRAAGNSPYFYQLQHYSTLSLNLHLGMDVDAEVHTADSGVRPVGTVAPVDICQYAVLNDYDRLHQDLSTNFGVMYEKGELRWPKRFSENAKQRMPSKPPSFVRGEQV